MHRKFLLTQLENYTPQTATEKKHLEEITQFVEKYPNCFDRNLNVGHITASAWIVNADQTQVLLTLHKKIGKWLQLGGHADNHPNTLEVALKEAREESGIENIVPISETIFDIDIHEIPAHKNEPAHLHFDIRYLFQVVEKDANYQMSTESLDLRWFSPETLRTIPIDHSVQRMLNKWLKL